MGKIVIYKGKSQYDVLRYFADGLYRELKKLRETELLDLSIESDDLYRKISRLYNDGMDLTIGFNIAGIKNLYSKYNIPHIAILVDHPIYHYHCFDLKSNNLYITCNDEEKLEFLQSVLKFEHSFVLNHAVDSSITANIYGEKNFDIVMLGSIQNSKKIHEKLKEKYNQLLFEMIEDVAEVAVNNSIFPIEDLIDTTVLKRHFNMDNVNMLNFYYALITDIESYVRNFAREKAIKSFKNKEIHIFGNCEGDAFENSENIIVHNGVDYTEALEILKKSKISLNSTKFMFNGSHERPLLAAACGAVVLTNKTQYFKKLFGDSAIYYNDLLLDDAIECVDEIISKDSMRINIAERANEIVMKNHTWKNRAEQIVNML